MERKNKIGIIGHVGLGSTVAEAILSSNKNVVIEIIPPDAANNATSEFIEPNPANLLLSKTKNPYDNPMTGQQSRRQRRANERKNKKK